MLELISYFNFVLALTISAAYFYQLVYLMYGLFSLHKVKIRNQFQHSTLSNFYSSGQLSGFSKPIPSLRGII